MDVTGLEPATPCLQSVGEASTAIRYAVRLASIYAASSMVMRRERLLRFAVDYKISVNQNVHHIPTNKSHMLGKLYT